MSNQRKLIFACVALASSATAAALLRKRKSRVSQLKPINPDDYQAELVVEETINADDYQALSERTIVAYQGGDYLPISDNYDDEVEFSPPFSLAYPRLEEEPEALEEFFEEDNDLRGDLEINPDNEDRFNQPEIDFDPFKDEETKAIEEQTLNRLEADLNIKWKES